MQEAIRRSLLSDDPTPTNTLKGNDPDPRDEMSEEDLLAIQAELLQEDLQRISEQSEFVDSEFEEERMLKDDQDLEFAKSLALDQIKVSLPYLANVMTWSKGATGKGQITGRETA